MHKNYFFLNRFVIEANSLIKNSSAVDIFSQEKEKLVIELKTSATSWFLEISVNPGFPFINLRNDLNRKKKNTINIFSPCLNEKLISVEIAKFDRIIRLNFEKSKIYFAIRGKFTNSVLIKDELMESFKKYSDKDLHNFSEEVRETDFSEYFNIPQIEKINNSNFLNGINKYRFIGKEIINEIKARDKEEKEFSKFNELYKILNEIRDEKPAVFLNSKAGEIHLAVSSFKSFPSAEVKKFDNYSDAQNFFLNKRYSLYEYQKKRKLIEKHLESELKKVTSKLNKLRIRIAKGNNEELYKKIANLLLINIKNIKKGMNEITVSDLYGESEIKIKLNPELSPKQNADRYFEKARNDRKSFEKSQTLYKELEKEFSKQKEFERKSLTVENIKDLNLLMPELKIRENNSSHSKENITDKFKKYIIENKYHVFVGKDSKNNDLLTTKFAKQNDYWFHARGLPGSHVVLRVDNLKEGVPKNILKATASLAAFHSKAKTAGTVPVSFTQKKYVVKKKGMAPGKVTLLKEDVLLVKPEIPHNCEYVENE